MFLIQNCKFWNFRAKKNWSIRFSLSYWFVDKNIKVQKGTRSSAKIRTICLVLHCTPDTFSKMFLERFGVGGWREGGRKKRRKEVLNILPPSKVTQSGGHGGYTLLLAWRCDVYQAEDSGWVAPGPQRDSTLQLECQSTARHKFSKLVVPAVLGHKVGFS